MRNPANLTYFFLSVLFDFPKVKDARKTGKLDYMIYLEDDYYLFLRIILEYEISALFKTKNKHIAQIDFDVTDTKIEQFIVYL